MLWLLGENSQSLHFPGKVESFIFNYLYSRDHVILYLRSSFTEEKKHPEWGPTCVSNKGKLSPGLLDRRSVHQLQARGLNNNAKKKQKYHLIWKASPGTLRNGLQWVSEKTQQSLGKTEGHCALGPLLVLSVRGDSLPQHTMQKRGSTLTRPKYQPMSPHTELIPLLPPSSYNSLFQANFSGRVYHIYNSLTLVFPPTLLQKEFF